VNGRTLGVVLWLHTLVMGVPGCLFFLLPVQASALWPWVLPPLAARFMGSLFLGGAVCSLACLRSQTNRGLFVIVLLAVGDVLIALSGLLAVSGIGFTPAMLGFLAFFLGAALLVVVTILRPSLAAPAQVGLPVTHALRGFFFVHLLVVLPVGLAMYFLPVWAQPLWPWKMAPINVRLIGSFFFGAAFISTWALRQRDAQALRPTLALYVTFATLATIAAVMHFALFNPARLATWAFFALYVFVAGASAVFLLHRSNQRIA
jgi:hypothetical protein